VDLVLDDEHRAIARTVRDFVTRELIPLEPELLRRERAGERQLTRDELADLRERARRSGLWGVGTPPEYGGAGLDPVAQALVRIELCRTFVPFTFGGSADNILFAATGDQIDTYLRPTLSGERVSCFALTEPGAGSDLSGLRTTARRVDGGWVIDGEKTFISRGADADFAMVFAVTGPRTSTSSGVTCFLVDRDRGWTSTPIPMMSSWEAATLRFDGVRVGDEHVLGEVGRGFELAMRWIGQGRWLVPCRAIGAAQRLLGMAVEYANTRTTWGAPLADRQAIQWMIADSAVELESVRMLTLRAAWLAGTGADTRYASAIAKLSGAAMANAVVDRVLQIHGGMGYTRELPIERWYRELRVLRIFEGTDEIQRRTIARGVLRGDLDVDPVGW
jgi:Acyl-CoA dehydrogenases